jgi:glycosyltransferase involved in cell wall biosynthesis
MMANDYTPEVSVIVPTRDSASDLRRCLASLTDVQGVSLEVIVVDQESTDGTTDVARAAGAAVLEVPRPSVYTPPTRSRNRGAAVARGEYLLHLDADMAIAPAALAAAVRACRESDHVALTLEELDVTDGFWAECKALERRTYRGSDIEAARFVRAEVFSEVGGYDESLGSGEDWDIHARYAGRGSIGRLAGAVHHNLGTVAFTAQLRKKCEYGRSAAGFIGKHDAGELSRAMLSSYGRSWRILARHPVHALGFIVLRVGEAGALAAGIAVEWIARRRARRPV